MTVIMDASVLVKLVAEEKGSPAARSLFISEPFLIAPDLALIEIFNALWRKIRQGHYTRPQLELAGVFIEDCLALIVPARDLLARA